MPGRLTHEGLEGYLSEANAPHGALLDLLRALRTRLLAHEDVEEEVVHMPPPARLMYRTSCNQVATLGFADGRLAVGIRLAGNAADEAVKAGVAAKHPHPIYARAGWVFAQAGNEQEAQRLVPWIERAHRVAKAKDACLD